MLVGARVLVALLLAASVTPAGRPDGTPQAGADDIKRAIGQLSSFDYPVRMEAARLIRRAPSDMAVPLLAESAKAHGDEYVRYRALTLLSGFGGPIAARTMADVVADANDRLRMVAYAWFEHSPDAAVLPLLLEALQRERSEFVRPALIRALVAHGADPRARDVVAPLVLRGEDYFRGAVIEALGEYGGAFALKDLAAVAAQVGPLQDDAVTAIGRLGDETYVNTLAGLQRTAPEELQPTLAAALCLLKRACEETRAYLKQTLAFATGSAGHQKLLRGAVHGLVMLALRGGDDSWQALIDAGVAAKSDTARAPIALGVGVVALRQPALVLAGFERRADLDASIELLRDAFDMLAEDYEEERFFVAVRRAYWAAADGSLRRRVSEALIQKLEF